MQQPDANGYVHISWPSKNIPHGGIFHTRIAEPTENQQQLLKVLLEESKLSITQRQKSAWKLRQNNDEQKAVTRQIPMPLVRPRTSRRRSLSEIRQSGIFEVDVFRPLKRGEDREKMKEKLANTMAYGDDKPQAPPASLPARLAKPAPKLPTNKDKWNDLVSQIRERSEWLAEMEYLGQAGPHREQIKDQIAERMRALDALGIDSEFSTPRSTISAFSTTRSKEPVPNNRSPAISAKSLKSVKSGKSNQSGASDKGKATRRSRTRQQEENVSALAQFSPLQYSPRRRV